eukprot:TRINITY_DN241_c0_g1_i5.p2 TRINITY_DN241_c0_g1~~TRINITY_DN241_c0_g1_i5.p2  ORF type:complete len:169 (-),score=66.58 TRINITY_DN241_c0_g1_i5:1453-1959(-)
MLLLMAAVQNGRGTDDKRSFIISYYLADDTLSIYEPPQRNSGVVGGKFLERRQVQKPKSKELYRESDLFVGAIIEVFNHRFKLRNADDYAFNYMEANTDAFPASDIDNIQKKLRALIASKPTPSIFNGSGCPCGKSRGFRLSVPSFERFAVLLLCVAIATQWLVGWLG